ncbi:cyclic nucleotide-gated ion channel 1-like [Pistacia vera]|uniref:cyclic nucleotide-gated ion channel 1-like n=1 Tax=Pistacia vera TaxID=55513 RepID=UPI0012634E74|nr:cyclic nucleotide-gated ion channel 1-like [Pistacia vera]
MATLKVPSQTPPAIENADQLREAFEGRLGVCCTDIEQIMPVEPSQEESYLARRAVGRDRLTDYNYDKSLGSCSLIDIPEVEQPERPRERIYPGSIAFETKQTIISDILVKVLSIIIIIRDKIPYPRGVFWNWTFLILCVIAIFLDPLFLYIPVINDEKKCLGLDRKLGKLAIALRSFMDFFYLIYTFFQLRTDSPAACLPYQRQPSFELYHRAPSNGKKYLRRFFPVDLLSILPLPQVIIFTPRNAMKLLHFFVIFHYMPRLIRIYPLFKKVKMTFYEIDDAIFTKASFNLLLYMLASQVFGALWYFFAIERETSCWKTACLNHAGCIHSPFYCHDNLGDYTFLSDLCPVKISNTTLFNFGIYQDALQSGIVEVTDFPLKFLHTFLWGLQSLSSFGQNLQTSSYVWEKSSRFGYLIRLGVFPLSPGKYEVPILEKWKTISGGSVQPSKAAAVHRERDSGENEPLKDALCHGRQLLSMPRHENLFVMSTL